MTFPKVVITTVPFVDEDTPLAAPAVLKSSLMAHGIECVALDLNIEIYNKIHHSPHRQLFLDFFYEQKIHEIIADDIWSMLDFYACELLAHQPDIIGLSLFTHNSQVFTVWLCAVLRQRAPNVKIVIGGPGLQTLEHSLFKFPDRIQRLGLIDDYITGDAETSLVEYVKGNRSYPGINSWSWVPNAEFDKLPMPDYSDYRFFRYRYPLLPIIDSRGCVQACEFCDVIEFWEKFQYLTADNIFSQMMRHIENYGVYRFQFSSSICNGNLKEFRKLVKLIATHNHKNSLSEQIHWVGSFIVRPASNHKEEMWQNIAESNGYLLTGVESLVEHVRIRLGKKFTNADLEHHIMMGRKYQVPMNLLMILCYHTETESDYEFVRQWFQDRRDFAGNTIQQVQLTLPAILPGTKLEKTIDAELFDSKVQHRKENAIKTKQVIEECGFNTRPFF